MSNQQTGQTALTKRNLWTYSLGTVGRDLAGTLFSGYLMTFVLFTKNLTTVQFMAISMIMVAARIFDAFNDPIMGNLLEVTRTKWGKFKPWIAIGMVLSCVVFYLSFYDTPLEGWNYVIFFGILYFSYSIAFTMNDIAYWGMVPALAGRKQDRDLLTSRTVLCAGVGGAIATIIIPTFTAGDLVIGGSAVTAYSKLTVLFCIAFLIMQSITLIGVKEEPLPPKGNVNKVSIKTIVKTIKNNDQLVWCIVILLCQQVGLGFINGTLAVNYIYFEFGYNGFYYTLFLALGSVAAAVMMLFFSQISKRFSRDQLMKAATIATVFGFLFMFIMGALIPSSMPVLKFAMLMVGNLFAFSGFNIFYLIVMICIANTVEYNEWKTGNRAEGIIFSIRPLVTKLSFAIVQFMVMIIFIVVGVREFTNQISDIENDAAKQLIDATKKSELIKNVLESVPNGKNVALLACLALIPVVLAIVAYYFYKKKYFITEEKYEEIVAELHARKMKTE